MFGWNFLLSSCSLVRLYVNLQVKVTEKKNGNFQSILRVGVCALHTLGYHVDWKVQSHGLIERLGKRMLKLRIFCNKKNVWVEGYPVSWAPCCKTWLKFEGEICDCEKDSGIFIYWVRTHWLGAMLWMKRKLLKMLDVMLWTNQKLGAIIVTDLKYRKPDFKWIIHLRLYSGP